MKSLVWIVFGIAALAQWLVPLASVWRYENVIQKGTLVRLNCRAPDPYDPLRGRYLLVALEPSQIPTPKDQVVAHGTQVYLLLKQEGQAAATVTGISLEKPETGLFMTVHADYPAENLTIRWPIERFYLNEALAPEADVWLAKVRSSNDPTVMAEIRVLDGKAVLVDLTYEGQSFRKILASNKKQ